MATSTAQGFIGAGDVYIARFVNGVKGPLRGPYETSKFAPATASTLKKLTSKSKANYGGIIESVPIGEPTTFSAQFKRIDKEALLLALLGTESSATNTGATITAADITVGASLDDWIPLPHGEVSAVTLTNAGASTTYVEGTHYVVNNDIGMIKILPVSGAPAPAAALKITYTHATYTDTIIRGGTNVQLRSYFLFDGINLVDGRNCIVDIWEAVMTSSGEFDFLADDFNTVTLNGDLKVPLGKTEPFTARFRDLA